MFHHCQSNVLLDPASGLSAQAWAAEPSLVELFGDPMFRQLLASDRVTMESFTDLVLAVRKRLAR
ncbi:hypothetical protein A6A04_01455 [Paramagnetospirillum marisnigri]|uniref:Uncharacterized protein n=1 Tax=Paramagnetospirillum marisnigri TaxID=1285242 RepID=A0A178MSY3_9PROT|nr:hypothetical protein [Paramagnetospirillum marisnigri]OAN52382.1 hypothetical protein A6A04_01455 [Paramagnetospirillum marisnigri]